MNFINADDDRIKIYDINIGNILKKNDRVQVKYGNKVVAQYICDIDKTKSTERLILKETKW